jgi:hypothetical protein
MKLGTVKYYRVFVKGVRDAYDITDLTPVETADIYNED